MKRILSFILVALICLPTFTLFGCGDDAKKSSEVGYVRVCNCADYIDLDLLDEFEEETGIKVIYSTFGTNENLYNELVINPNSYDLVVPSEYMIEKLAVEGRIQPLNFDYLTDYQDNLSDYIQGRLNDIEIKEGKYAGNKISDFMVGYMWGTMGWVYNTDNVNIEDVKSWYGVFENQDLSKRITIKDAVRDSYIIGLAMVYEEQLKQANSVEEISAILNNTNQDAIDLVGERLNSLKPMLYGFEVDSGKNDIVLGNIDAYVAWSGDGAYAIDVAAREAEDEDGELIAEENIRNLSYYVPDEGSNIWFDGFVMPSASTNYTNVYKFLEFISRPENVIRNIDETGYTSMVATDEIYEEIVLGWFDESEDLEEGEGITVDLSYFFGEGGDYTVTVSEESYGRLMAQYPSAEIVSRCAVMSYFDSYTLLKVNEMWEKVKGQTFPTWVIVLTICIVAVIAIIIVLIRHKDKIKWLKLPQRKTTYAERKGLKIVKVENLD